MNAHVESERSILGAMFRSAAAVTTATERLIPSDFYDPANREIFSAMMTVALNSRPVDLTTVDAELTRLGKLENVGGAAYLVQLVRTVPSATNVDAYIGTIIEQANMRRIEAIAESIKRKAASGELTADSIIEKIEGACNDITSRSRQRDGGWSTMGEAALEAFESTENPTKAIGTGFKELDAMLCGGLQKTELTIVGARPGKGKSSFMLAAAMNAAESGAHVGFFSLEMSKRQIAQRALAATSLVGVSKQRVGGDAMTQHDWEMLTTGLERLSDTGVAERLHIYEAFGLTLERLANIARHAVQRGELDLLVLDYIQLLRTTEKANAEFERLGIVSKGLKQLALSLNIPILTAAQVRRQGAEDTKKGGRAPTLDELRGSGDLEQDADNVLLIHSPDNPDDPTIKRAGDAHAGIWERAQSAFANPFTVEIAKQRQGPTGRIWCLFKPMTMRFYDDVRGDTSWAN